MRRLVLWVPFLLFAGIGIFAAVSLIWPASRDHPSFMVGQPLPAFDQPAAMPGKQPISRADYAAGRPRLVNVFASWCVPCAAEAPQLMALARQGVAIDAVAVRDRPEDVARFLGQWGDPYQKISLDRDSAMQIAIGSAGVPETFVVDGRGIIRYQHIGPINGERDMQTLLAKLEEARRS
jgi:cytochrome c biogenesis protein CcmG, thiol:disulfide interchange protein DsbE